MKSIYHLFFILSMGIINLSYGAEQAETPLQKAYAIAETFLDACKRGDIDYLNAHQDKFTGELFTRPDEKGITPLQAAITISSLPVVQFLLDRTVDYGDDVIQQAEDQYVASCGEVQLFSSREILRLVREMKRQDCSVDYWRKLGEKKHDKLVKSKKKS